MHLKWDHVMKHLGNGEDPMHTKKTLINNSQMGENHPIELPDGTTFYGFYPTIKRLLPMRTFSADGKTVYLSTFEVATLKIMAVEIETLQVSILIVFLES